MKEASLQPKNQAKEPKTHTPSLFHEMCEREAQKQRFEKFFGYRQKTDSDKAWDLMNFSL